MKNLIHLKNVCLNIKNYNSNNTSIRKLLFSKFVKGNEDLNRSDSKDILKNINLEIKPGDKVGIIGLNGSGKSTLLRVVAGIYPASGGTVITNGSINCLIDIFSGFDVESSGYDNIVLRGLFLGHSKKEIVDLAPEIIKLSGLEEFIHSPIKTYSSGMLMKLAFFITLSKKAEIVLMDEWLSVGDERFQITANKQLRRYLSSSSCLLLASHSHELLREVTNKAVWIDDGKIMAYGQTNEVVCKYLSI